MKNYSNTQDEGMEGKTKQKPQKGKGAHKTKTKQNTRGSEELLERTQTTTNNGQTQSKGWNTDRKILT